MKKRVLALGIHTNHAMSSHIVRKNRSLLDLIEEVTWSHELNSHIWNWFESHVQDCVAQEDKDCCHPHILKI